MDDVSDVCRFCGKKGAIKYYYLSLHDKIRMWCSSERFCKEMTAHWEERDHWLDCEDGWMPHKYKFKYKY